MLAARQEAAVAARRRQRWPSRLARCSSPPATSCQVRDNACGVNRAHRRACNLNQDLTACVVEQGPGARVAGMLGGQPIRSRAAVVGGATLPEDCVGGRDGSDMLAGPRAAHLRSKQVCLLGPPARIVSPNRCDALPVAARGRMAHAAVASTASFLLAPLGTQWPWLLGGGGEKGSRSHGLEPPMVSPDLASLLFPSSAVSIRRHLCAPELSPPALVA